MSSNHKEESKQIPVWEIELHLGHDTFRVLTLEKQWHYDEYENYEDDEPVGYLTQQEDI